MHSFSVHNKSVYKLQPTNCVFDPPTRSEYSCDSGSSVLRCSSVRPLFASPNHQAPTMYAVAVSREYMTCDDVRRYYIEEYESTNSSYTHEVVIELESLDAYGGRTRYNPQCNKGDSYPKEGECFSCESVSHLPTGPCSTAIEDKRSKSSLRHSSDSLSLNEQLIDPQQGSKHAANEGPACKLVRFRSSTKCTRREKRIVRFLLRSQLDQGQKPIGQFSKFNDHGKRRQPLSVPKPGARDGG